MSRPPLIFVLLTLALVCGLSGRATAAPESPPALPRFLVVSFAPELPLAKGKARLADAHVKVTQTLDCAHAAVVSVAANDDKTAAKLRALPGVVSVETDDPLPAPRVTSQPLAKPHHRAVPLDVDPDDEFISAQWNLPMIQAFHAWDYTTGAADAVTTVAVLDTGIDLDHADLAGQVFLDAAWNFFDDNADVQDVSQSGSGTMVAGIIAATANNGTGIAGI